MKLSYDEKVDALYIQLKDEKPEGVVEIREGVGLDLAADGKILGIEILDASKKIDFKSMLSYTIDEGLLHSVKS